MDPGVAQEAAVPEAAIPEAAVPEAAVPTVIVPPAAVPPAATAMDRQTYRQTDSMHDDNTLFSTVVPGDKRHREAYK